MIIQADFKNKHGEWVQRSYIGKKYTWTKSGVLWNNIKERCTAGGATQSREPTYVGCINSFTNFQEFTDWHIKQVGYSLGYQLDADILRQDTKEYSESKCVLIPPALNKFLQTTETRRGVWPQGIHEYGDRLYVRCRMGNVKSNLGSFSKENVLEAVGLYTSAKNLFAKDWYNRLSSDEFTVDTRVIEYIKNWKHVCDWKPNGQV